MIGDQEITYRAKEIFTGKHGQNILKNFTDILSKKAGNISVESQNGIKDKLFQYVDLLKKEFLIDENDNKCVREYVYRILNKDVVSNEKTAFVFGAGISAKPFEIPSWPKLLERALIGLFYKDFIVDDIECKIDEKLLQNEEALLHVLKNRGNDFFNGMDVYEFAQYIDNELRERNCSEEDALERSRIEMFEIVRSALYSDFPEKYCDNIKVDNEFKKSLIYRLCVVAQSPHIGRIVTYNYDDLFEASWEATKQKNYTRKLNSICVDGQLPFAREDDHHLTIYHVHGLVPRYKKGKSWRKSTSQKSENIEQYLNSETDQKNSESQRLILSERSYDDMAHASYKWRNTLQIDTFLRYNCIFLGFSATDKNFKRITKLMDWHLEDEPDSVSNGVVNIHPKHYIFFCIDEMIKQIFELKGCAKKELQEGLKELAENPRMLMARVQFFYYTLRIKRKYLKRYHVYPVWTTTTDISDLIGNLTGSI